MAASKRTRDKEQDRERASKTELTVFCNLIMDMMSYHFSCILFIRNGVLNSAQTQREGIIQGPESQEVGTVRVI